MNIYITDTYSNGNNWYRKYSNGWVEQGGYVSGARDATVELLVPMKDTNYTILTSKNTDSYDSSSVSINTYNKKNTSFDICAWGQGRKSYKGSATGFWTVFGFAK